MSWYSLVRPLLFQLDAERAHGLALRLGSFRGHLHRKRGLGFPTQVGTITFRNRVGVAAGLDKNGELLHLWDKLGIGFAEIGSVTMRPSNGNPRPRAFRLPKDQAVINRMGLNNHGVETVVQRINTFKESSDFPVGLSVAKTHDPSLVGDAGLDDIVRCFTVASSSAADYITINISCPNTAEGKTFEDPTLLKELLSSLPFPKTKTPIYVKLSPDLEWSQLDAVIESCLEHNVTGFVACNTSNKRSGLQTPSNHLEKIGRGGLSGAPLFERACSIVRHIRDRVGNDIPLMGVGGIDSPTHAQQIRTSGADAVQLYTGLIYKGPGLLPGLIRALHTNDAV